jgi:hypothetical protein
MKLSIRVTTLSAIALASSMLTYGFGGQPTVRPTQTEQQDAAGAPRAVQQGKGASLSRNQPVTVNRSRALTREESRAVRPDPAVQQQDHAFRK